MTNDPTNPAGQITPACNAYAITTSDSATLSPITRAVYVGGTGDLKVVMRGG